MQRGYTISRNLPAPCGDMQTAGRMQVGSCRREGGGGRGSCGLPPRAPVPNPAAAAAVDVHNAVDFAAALHTLVKGWTECKNVIDVDPQAGCVSHQQDDYCVIFSCSGTQPVQFAKVDDGYDGDGVPQSYIGAEHAQQVHRDQITNVQLLAALTLNRKHASPRLSSSATPPQHQLSSFVLFCSSTSCVLC
jgi:hypothetical protein